MTRMLVGLADARDAAVAAAGGVDVVEVRMAGIGDARPLDPTAIRAIRAAFPGTLRLRIDDPAQQLGATEAAIAFGADEIAMPIEAIPEAKNILTALAPLTRPVTLVAIVLADGDLGTPPEAMAGLAGSVVLDVCDGTRLIDALAIDQLDAFAGACRGAAIPFGLAGGLEAPDVARLLVLQPDLLGFDVALRRDHRPDHALDAKAVATIRALIPHDARVRGSGGLIHTDETDHIFVHDFVALLSIGAYQAERGVRQRVRFSVDADVRRPAEPPTDMRGVFSYDIIIETIRVLAARAHVTFVETLAEELAATLLAYPQLTLVSVKVEKLDVIEGSVGIVITRDRASLPIGAA
ncbi:dihydroneopterin aldolase [Beijerinckia sp. L45]|uniref:dihydroneopterin aldolase n=1 Tax=Beijerinckia sp. L45 TaxID=1641855 RepID=UPI00131C822D|nr:dihydroneopterin aldolase [Beijerinckia sp. L45]